MHGQNAGISRVNAVEMLEFCYDMHSQNAGISGIFCEPDNDNAAIMRFLVHHTVKMLEFRIC